MRWLMGLVLLLALTGSLEAAEQDIELSVGDRTVLATLCTPAAMQAETPLVVVTHGTLAHKDMDLIKTLTQALADRGIVSLAHTLWLGQDRRKGIYDCAARHDYVTRGRLRRDRRLGCHAQGLTRYVYTFGHSRGGSQVARYLAAGATTPPEGRVLFAPVTGTAEAAFRAAYGKPLEPLLD